MSFHVKGKRGDCDNLQKSLLDALNTIAWIDDSQIVKWSGEIVKDADQRTEVVVYSVEKKDRISH